LDSYFIHVQTKHE